MATAMEIGSLIDTHALIIASIASVAIAIAAGVGATFFAHILRSKIWR